MRQQNDIYIEASRSELASSKKAGFDQNINQQILTTTDNIELERECRICLEGNNSEQDPLIAPCHCTGTLKYVHRTCLKIWVLKMFQNKEQRQRNKLIEQGLECQLCKYLLNISIFYQSKCIQQGQFFENIKKSLFLFIVFLFFFTVNIICIIFFIQTIITGNMSYSNSPVALIVLLLCVICLLIVEIGLTFKFVCTFCREEEMIIDGYVLKPGLPKKEPQLVVILAERVQQQGQ